MKKQCDKAIARLQKTRLDSVFTERDRDAAIRLFKWLKTATPSEILALSVKAGIHHPDGTLTDAYKDI